MALCGVLMGGEREGEMYRMRRQQLGAFLECMLLRLGRQGRGQPRELSRSWFSISLTFLNLRHYRSFSSI